MLAESFLRSGKVRDLYALHDGRLLLVASDRISRVRRRAADDDPRQGRVLTGLSRFWFAETAGIVPNHLLDTTRRLADTSRPTSATATRRPTSARSTTCAAG